MHVMTSACNDYAAAKILLKFRLNGNTAEIRVLLLFFYQVLPTLLLVEKKFINIQYSWPIYLNSH